MACLRRISGNGAAVVIAVVAGDLTAVHVEYALMVLHGDGTAAATLGDFTAGELAAEHIQSAGIEVNAGTAPDVLRCALDGAATLAVAEDKPGVISNLDLFSPLEDSVLPFRHRCRVLPSTIRSLLRVALPVR